MSALVAYGSSGDEDSDTPEDSPPRPPAGQKASGLVLPAPKDAAKPTVSSMFASLPPPKKEASPVLTEENDIDIPVPIKAIKPEVPPAKQRVKITIPSLLDFKDDEDSAPRAKKVKPTPKGSGLLAILPEPKNVSSRSSRPMLPYVLTKRPVPPKPVVPKRPAAPKVEAPLVTSYPDSDEDSGDGDFFSLSSHTPAEPAEINLEDLLPPTLGPSVKPQREVAEAAVSSQPRAEVWEEEAGSSGWQPPQEDTIEPPDADLQLDEAALLKLCGRRSKRSKEDLQLIELHGNNMLPDPKDWMLKQMTEEQEMHGHRNSQPSSAHRRKHQITYLAFQAKEREIELKNQWSQNRQTKKQTQAKYGF